MTNHIPKTILILMDCLCTLLELEPMKKGVEDETLACGTGVTAVAIAMHIRMWCMRFEKVLGHGGNQGS